MTAMRNTLGRVSLLLLAVSLVASLAHAHPGGLDQNGCHHNRKTGDFHCHRKIETERHGTAETETRTVPRQARVRRVIDGDTIVLDGGERVRLIGVDTPETKHPTKPVERFGKEASAFTRRMADGKHVRLEFDQANAHLGHKDRYGRTLAYVFLEDGKLLNAEIVKQGYGFAYTRFPFERVEEFREHQREAREQGRGLWAEERVVNGEPGHSNWHGSRNDRRADRGRGRRLPDGGGGPRSGQISRSRKARRRWRSPAPPELRRNGVADRRHGRHGRRLVASLGPGTAGGSDLHASVHVRQGGIRLERPGSLAANRRADRRRAP